jgi:hypothetical protein
VVLLTESLPNPFPIHGQGLRGGDAGPYGLPFDREDDDHQVTVRHHESFTGLATEDEHLSSSVG